MLRKKLVNDETAGKVRPYRTRELCKGYWLRSVKISFSSGPVGAPTPPSASSSLKLLSLYWSTSILRNADAEVSFLPSFLDISVVRSNVSYVHARLIEQRLASIRGGKACLGMRSEILLTEESVFDWPIGSKDLFVLIGQLNVTFP